jgi:hypothetical protein
MPKYKVTVRADDGKLVHMGIWESEDGEEAVANMVTYAFRDSFGYYPDEILTEMIGGYIDAQWMD